MYNGNLYQIYPQVSSKINSDNFKHVSLSLTTNKFLVILLCKTHLWYLFVLISAFIIIYNTIMALCYSIFEFPNRQTTVSITKFLLLLRTEIVFVTGWRGADFHPWGSVMIWAEGAFFRVIPTLCPIKRKLRLIPWTGPISHHLN